MNQNTIHVAYAGNDPYRDAILISVMSLAKATNDRPIHLYFLTGDFTDLKPQYQSLTKESADFILSHAKSYNPNMEYTLLNMEEYFGTFFLHNHNKKCAYTPYSMLRLLLDHVPDLPSKLLYIDGDTIVMKNVAELYDTDMSEYELGMVQDYVGHHYFGKRYCNSGVILMNLDLMKESNLLHRTRKFLKSHRLFMPDQTSLNATCKRKLILPRKYNEQSKANEDTVIRHYCKVLHWLPYIHTVNIKPWHIQDFRKHFGDTSKDIIDAYEAIKKQEEK